MLRAKSWGSAKQHELSRGMRAAAFGLSAGRFGQHQDGLHAQVEDAYGLGVMVLVADLEPIGFDLSVVVGAAESGDVVPVASTVLALDHHLDLPAALTLVELGHLLEQAAAQVGGVTLFFVELDELLLRRRYGRIERCYARFLAHAGRRLEAEVL